MKKTIMLGPLIFSVVLLYQHFINILESYINDMNIDNNENFVQYSSFWNSRHLLEISSHSRLTKNIETLELIEPALKIFDCTNIHLINVSNRIGDGVFKQKFRAEFNGKPLIVKMVTPETKEIKVCLDKVRAMKNGISDFKLQCYGYGEFRVIQEILMLHEMLHFGFAKLVGYCLRNSVFFDGNLNRQGLIAVYEYGDPVTSGSFSSTPWSERLRQALELSKFLRYLRDSPLGSLLIPNLEYDSFINVKSHIKLLDMDIVLSYEKECKEDSQCDFQLECSESQCRGHNAQMNLIRMRDLFFSKLLLPDSYPGIIKSRVVKVHNKLMSMSITIDELVNELQGISDTAFEKIMDYLNMA